MGFARASGNRNIEEWHSIGKYENGSRIKRAIKRYKEKYNGEKKWEFKVKASDKIGYIELFARRQEGADGRHWSATPFWDIYRIL